MESVAPQSQGIIIIITFYMHPQSLLPGDRTTSQSQAHLTVVQTQPYPWKQNPRVPLVAEEMVSQWDGEGELGMLGPYSTPRTQVAAGNAESHSVLQAHKWPVLGQGLIKASMQTAM